MVKSTQTEITKRIGTVGKLLIGGKSSTYILQYGSDKWSVSERQIETYIQRARVFIIENVTKEVKYDFSLAIQRLNDLYDKSLENGDFRTCVAIIKEMTNLQGIAKNMVDINLKGEVAVRVNHDLAKKTPKELKDHIRKLRAANKKRRKELGLPPKDD